MRKPSQREPTSPTDRHKLSLDAGTTTVDTPARSRKRAPTKSHKRGSMCAETRLPVYSTCISVRQTVLSPLEDSSICVLVHASRNLLASTVQQVSWSLWRQVYKVRVEQLDKLLILHSDLANQECKSVIQQRRVIEACTHVLSEGTAVRRLACISVQELFTQACARPVRVPPWVHLVLTRRKRHEHKFDEYAKGSNGNAEYRVGCRRKAIRGAAAT